MNFPLRIVMFPLFFFGMAAFIWYEIWKAFSASWANVWAVFSVITIAWAMIVRFVEFETPVWLALVGYMYLPFTGLMFMFLAGVEVVDFISGRAITRHFSAQRVLLAVFFLVVGLLVYGYFEATKIELHEITIPTDKLPPNVDLVRVVQISDLHIGKVFSENRLEQVMELARLSMPDLLVLTGDIVDADLRERADLAQILGAISPPLGKFAVTGNHEHYAGFDQAIEFIKKSGYTVLRSEWEDVGSLVVAGVDDMGRVFSSSDGSAELLSSLPSAQNEKFVVFLKHQPFVNEQSVGLFDIQLSGHTHGGQIFPFRLITYLTQGVLQGLSEFSGEQGKSLLYVSNGTGFWGPPVRIFSPPEVTVFNVKRR